MEKKYIPVWKNIYRKNIVSREELASYLQLTREQREQLLSRPRFALNIPMRLAKKMEKGRVDTPLFKQFVATDMENIEVEGFEADPVEDFSFRCSPKLLKKYAGRVLFLTTSACAMHCRFCFRQNFDYEVDEKTYDEELRLIQNDSSINEVILSGGDPLSLPDEKLEPLLMTLSEIDHVTKIRFHSRFPVGIPERIDDSFLAMLSRVKKQIIFIAHINHPDELDTDVLEAFKKLGALGIPVLNQSVLLRGVNDDLETLSRLFLRQIDHGIIPYYLHQLDRVHGTAHFEVSEEKGHELMEGLKKNLPGYAVPRFVREIPGRSSKTVL